MTTLKQQPQTKPQNLMNCDKWHKEQLINFLKFANEYFPKPMEKIYMAYDEMKRGN